MADARISLGDLNSTAARGAERLGVEAHRILDQLVEEFTAGQALAILEQGGWKPSLPRYRYMQFQVTAMVRG